MTNRQALLCRLLKPSGLALPPPSSFEEAVDTADLPLAALSLAREGAIKRFERVLPAIDGDTVALLSRQCLLLGLSRDPKGAFLLFDALRRQHRAVAIVWLDLAVLQAAWGREVQALRSIALYNVLAGKPAVGHLPAFPATAVDQGGPIHFLAGDESRFYAV